MRRMSLLLVALAALLLGLIAWWGVGNQSTTQSSEGGLRNVHVGPRLARSPGRGERVSGSIEGRVLVPGGGAAPGAQLVLTGGYDGEDVPKELPGPVAEVQADAAGRFRFADLDAGLYVVTAALARPGMAPAISEDIALAAGQHRSIELRLSSGGVVLGGGVSDSGGGPLAGALVTVFPLGKASEGGVENLASVSMPLVFPMLRATTDKTGGYALSLSRGQQAVMVDADGYVSQGETLSLEADTKKDFRLDPGASIAGRVLARAGGQPLADAEVSVSREGMVSTRRHQVTTDGTGAFRLTGLGPGNYVLEARQDKLVGHSDQLQLVAGQRLESVAILCDASFAVIGRVAWPHGTAPEQAWVSAMSPGRPGDIPGAEVRAGGTFQIDGLLPGSYRLQAHVMRGPTVEKQVRIEDRDLTGVVLDLGRNNVIRGVVRAESGPVARAEVLVAAQVPRPRGGGKYNSSLGGTADEQGHFEIGGVVGANIVIHAHRADIGLAQWGPQPLTAALAGPVTLELRAGASLSGQVRSADGRPAAGALVSCVFVSEGGYRQVKAEAGRDGRYVMRGLPAGDIGVEVRAADDAPQRSATSIRVRLAAAEQKKVDLQLLGRTRLEGRVLLPDGRPAAGARVVAGASERGLPPSDAPRVTSDERGGFSLEDLDAADSYDVWAGLPGYGDAHAARVPARQENVVLRLSAESSAAGMVVDGAGKPVTDYYLTMRPTTGPQSAADAVTAFASSSLGFRESTRVRDARGAFELRALPAGSYELRAWGGLAGHNGRLLVTLAAGEHKRDLRIRLQGGVALRGRLVEADSGRPLADVTVEALGRDAQTGSDGTFALEDLPRLPLVPLSFGLEGRGYYVEPESVPVAADAKVVDAGTIRFVKGDMAAKFEGGPPGLVGVTHEARDGNVILTRVFPDLPAQRAGLVAGDHLLAVDGRPLAGLSQGSRSYLMKGKPGTPVTLTVQSGAQQRTVTITRQAPPP